MVQISVGHTRISRLLTNKMVKWLFKIFRFTDCSSLHLFASMVEQALDIEEVYESIITSRTSCLVTLYWDALNGETVVW